MSDSEPHHYTFGEGDRYDITGPGPWPAFALALYLAQYWGVFPYRERVEIVGWTIEHDELVGPAGIVTRQRGDSELCHVMLYDCNLHGCTPEGAIAVLADLVLDAPPPG